jgi:hypothetical protein
VADTVLRTEMDQGPAKTRRRTTAGVRTLTMAYILSAAQTAVLDDFYLEDLSGGSLSFDYTHPRTAATVTTRFKKPPAYIPLNGGYFRAVLEMEILP